MSENANMLIFQPRYKHMHKCMHEHGRRRTTTVEHPKRGHYGDGHFVLSREVVLFRRFLFSRMRSENYCNWVCLCLCVCLVSQISLIERLFVLKTLSPTQRETKIKTLVGICLKRPRSRVVQRNTSEKSNMLTSGQLSPLDPQQSARGYPMIVNNIQPCPKRCLLMPLARVGARTGA